MKYVFAFLGAVAVVFGICFCRSTEVSSQESEYLRIHILANSSSKEDENIKYEVKDEVVAFLAVLLENAQNKAQAEALVSKNLSNICRVADAVLQEKRVGYGTSAKLSCEQMPLRSYDNLTLPEGEYSCLQISLGQGKGDNWWCVVFPTVCFYDQKNSGFVEYKSKFWDMIKMHRIKFGGFYDKKTYCFGVCCHVCILVRWRNDNFDNKHFGLSCGGC